MCHSGGGGNCIPAYAQSMCIDVCARVCIDICTCVEYVDIATIDRAILVQIQNAKRDLVFVLLLLLLLCD